MGDKQIASQRQGFARRVMGRVFGQGGDGMARSSGAEAASRLQQWVSRVGRGNYAANLQSAYHETVAVYRCVNVIARAVARAPLQVYVGETLIKDGPVNGLLDRPNPYMTQTRFVEMVAVQTLLNGNGFVRAETGDLSGQVLWLLPISPMRVKPIRDVGNPYSLHGWRIKSQGGVRDVSPQEMIHIPYAPDPNDPILGVSPLGVARLVVETDYDAALYNQSILKNSGNPSGVLKWLGEDPLTDEEVSALSQRWADNYAGADRAGKTAVLSGNFDFQATAMPLKDMQYLEARKWNLADIARAFSVPLVFLNEYESSGLSDAGLRVQERMLYHQTVIPFARQIEQSLTEFIRTHFGDSRLSVVFNFDVVEALAPEATAKFQQAQQLATLGYPLNVINSALDLGMPTMPWGNDALVAAGLTTAQAVVDMATLPLDLPSPEVPPPTVTVEPPPNVPPPQLPAPDVQPDAPAEPGAPPASVMRETDFPTQGEDNAVSLRNSRFPQFDFEWATDLKDNYKAIWDAGGNIRGDEAFQHWGKVRDNGGRPETPAQEGWVREREAWMARHEGDGSQFSDKSLSPTLSNVAGIVAVIKWGGIATIGEGRMKEVLNDLKAKLDARSRLTMAEESRAALWRAIDARSQEHYRATLGRIRKALIKMRRQALEALDAQRKNRAATAAPQAVADDIDEQELVTALRPRFIAAFVAGYEEAFADLGTELIFDDASLFQLSRPEINRIAESYFDSGLGRVVEIGSRIKEMVRDTLIEGHINGEALDDLADRVRDVFNASAARATTIARTETQIALNGGTQSRYERELPEQAKVQWLSSRDSKVRDSHADVDGEIIDVGGVYTNGLGFPCDPSGPPEEIVNCRCYQIPVVQGIADPQPAWDPEEE